MSFYKIVFVFVFIVNGTFAQIIKVPLKDTFSNNNVEAYHSFSMTKGAPSLYRGIDSAKFVKWKVYADPFNSQQLMAETLLNKLTRAEYLKYIKTYSIDTTYILFKKFPENIISTFWGIDSFGKTHVIVDTDNNKNFGDNHEYIFDSNDHSKPIVNVTLGYFTGKEIRKIYIPLEINVYPDTSHPVYIDGIKFSRELELENMSYKIGTYKIGKKKFIFQEGNYHLNLYDKEPFFVNIQESINDNLISNSYLYKSSDTLEFDNAYYKIDSLDNDTLYLRWISNTRYDGGRINTLAPPISGTDIATGSFFSLARMAGHYVVLNFWGSWCIPCINELPRLHQLFNTYSDKNVEFIGIATDDSADINKLRRIIAVNHLTWNNLFIDRKNLHGSVDADYKITAYPTSILINPNGKILIRGEGKSTLDSIEAYLVKNRL